MREWLEKLARGETLTREEAEHLMGVIMDGGATPSQIGALLMALRLRGETVEEVSGFAQAMRARATPVPVARRPVLDTCGTGGDGSESLNVSTLSALTAAGAGVPVAKHGNRSASSRCGSADLLEALGVALPESAADAGRSVDEVGFGFLYAPLLHTSMRHAVPVRRELGLRTVFNLLGPLTNPAGAEYQLLGVFGAEWVEPVAAVLANLGARHALVVHGAGLDELSTEHPSHVAEVREGRVARWTLDPAEVGVAREPVHAIRGGDPKDNARMAEAILAGTGAPGTETVALNAGAALFAADRVDSVREGVEVARRCLERGDAGAVLHRLRERSVHRTA
jgi:anthranilate phosphoribosyltransferase